MSSYDEPYLFEELHMMDAEDIKRTLDKDTALYITHANGRYFLKTRHYHLGNVWTLHMELSLSEARALVVKKIAGWWVNVDESVK